MLVLSLDAIGGGVNGTVSYHVAGVAIIGCGGTGGGGSGTTYFTTTDTTDTTTNASAFFI